jgi:hypothetical protein
LASLVLSEVGVDAVTWSDDADTWSEVVLAG